MDIMDITVPNHVDAASIQQSVHLLMGLVQLGVWLDTLDVCVRQVNTKRFTYFIYL